MTTLSIPNSTSSAAANDCPLCGDPPIATCRCRLRDSRCANGHRWFTCPAHGVKLLGEASHAVSSGACQCGGDPDPAVAAFAA